MTYYRARAQRYMLERKVYKQPTWFDKLLGREGGYEWEQVITAEKDYIKLLLSNLGVEAEWVD